MAAEEQPRRRRDRPARPLYGYRDIGAAVRVHCYTSWDTLPQLEAFLARGYTFERLLEDMTGAAQVERSLVMEKVF